MFEPVIEAIRQHRQEWGFAAGADDFSVIRRTSTWLGTDGKVVFLVFKKGEKLPVLVLKTVHKADTGHVVTREAKNVFELWHENRRICQGIVPEPVALIEIAGLPVYVERALPGTTLPELVNRQWTARGQRRILNEGVAFGLNWIANLIGSRTHETHPVENLLRERLRQFQKIAPEEMWESPAIQDLRDFVGNADGSAFPLVPAHGDFWGGSLLYGMDQRWHVIDWEFFQPAGLPLLDYFMLAVHPGVCLGAKKGSLSAEFAACFEDTTFTRLIREQVTALGGKLNLNSRQMKSLFLVFLIEMTLERGLDSGDSVWFDCLKFYILNSNKIKILP
jgi:hypothetical protein